MKSDINKAIENISYNHHNQSSEVDLGYFDKLSNRKTVYTYTATGTKLKTEIYSSTTLKSTTEYCGAFVYEDNKLSYINIPGGRIVNCQSSIINYEYNLTDHLGNLRVSFTKNENGDAEIIQEDHYYPFGMRMNGQHFSNTELINNFLYNGKELQEQTGYYDYGFRQLDPALGRWHVIDAHAESYLSHSPYSYVYNNPISFTDLLGLDPEDDPNNPNPYGDASLDLRTYGFEDVFSPFSIHEIGPTGEDYDTWLAMGGGGEGSDFAGWYAAGGRAGMDLNEYLFGSTDMVFSFEGEDARNFYKALMKQSGKKVNNLLASIENSYIPQDNERHYFIIPCDSSCEALWQMRLYDLLRYMRL